MTASLHRLANGVRVICDPMLGLETLALTVVAGRGSRWERAAQSGWAHLLEHMVFKGAGARSARDIVEVIEAAGGSINAATGYERTSFQVRALKGGLPLAMEICADLILRPTLNPEELKRETQVVAQEIAEAADTPDDRVFDLAQAQAFADQPLGRPILGGTKTVDAATAQSLSAFRAGLYDPRTLVVSAAGAVDEADLLHQAEQAFGEASGGGLDPAPAARFVGGIKAESRKLEQANLVLLLPAPGVRDPDYFSLRVLAEALGGGMSSRLFQEVRERLGLAYAIDAFAETYEDTGVLGVYAGTAAGDAVRAAEVVAAQIADIADRADPAEIARSKAQLKAHIFMARESPLARAEQSAGQALLFDRLFSPAEIAEAVDSVDAQSLARVARGLLKPGLTAGAVLGPKAALGAPEAFTRALFG